MYLCNNKNVLAALSFFLAGIALSSSQVSVDKLALDYGQYDVGFQHYLAIDSTRTYKRIMDFTNGNVLREIPISIWYPANKELISGTRMIVQDYMQVLKEEEEWEHLSNEFILNWFYYPNTRDNQTHMTEEVKAQRNANSIEGTFPTVIYAPSYQASSIENFALCEFLASHGFVVISSPGRGSENRFYEGGTEKDMETQARDIEFLIKVSLNTKNVNQNAIATMGFSFGGLSNVLAQVRNGLIKAIVSLDGSIKYQYPTLQKSPFFSADKVNVPFIHLAQKPIPEQVLKEDKIDALLNEDFKFYDDLTQSEAYSLRLNNMTHSYFSTLGILFQPRDLRQDKMDKEIMESYKWMSIYTLKFLDAYLNDNKEARDYLVTEPVKNGVPSGIIFLKSKKPLKSATSFEDFNEMAAKNDYEDLLALYESIKKNEPQFKLEEHKLNTLGLQLVIDPAKSIYGIAIFKLAVILYPESANLFDSLAEGYLFLGDKENAIIYFEKSLELNAENQNAITRLEQLKG